jgi:hypothetical protein
VKTGLIRCISHTQYWTVLNEVHTFEHSQIHIVETKQGLSTEYQSNITSMAKRKSKNLIRPYSMCFWEPSRCDGKIPPFSAIILQTKVIGTKWCQNRANSMHFIHLMLNRLERGSNVRIHPNTCRWNQTKFIELISVHLTSMAKRKLKPLIRLNSRCFKSSHNVMGKYPHFRR